MPSNAWIVTSTLLTPWGRISPSQRFAQTLSTISHIRRADHHSWIIVVDNSSSNLPEEWTNRLQHVADHHLYVGDQRPHQLFNSMCIKGAGEARMTLSALSVIKQELDSINRLFKICGRYRPSSRFDAAAHQHHGCWVFKTPHWSMSNWRQALHTQLWSACGTILDLTEDMVSTAASLHLIHNLTLEEAMLMAVSQCRLKMLQEVGVEGQLAENQCWIQI